MLQVLGAACGSAGMAGGQAMDLGATGGALDLPGLERMHAHKTGALIRAAVRLGALAGGCRDETLLAMLERYAHAVGLAFQVRDDILDVEGDTEVIGKTAGKDAAQAKPTFPSILGMDASRRHLADLTDEALAAIAPLGARADLLGELARYAAQRAN
jgi:geranylgeranyl pyrophosphate synthase